MTSTTVRVSRELRDRLARRAASQGTSLAGAIERALGVEERTEFWARVEATMATPDVQTSLRADIEALAGTLRDGLDPSERWDDVV